MEREWTAEESIVVGASAERVYRAVADVERMGRWSPECRAVWVPRPPVRCGTRFLGLNRKGPWVWVTECRVQQADPGRGFAFRVTTFGLPVALWGYRFEPEAGGTRVTEYWQDLRTGRLSGLTELLGRAFTGTRPADRHRVNRAGMRTTLERLKRALEA
ncbi:SRPBCC family protein [Wenjunlia tyrosinilytica]|uniref:SRPBCC family protein n=1 Tax=Wenjunlia tyrosinilytica TaxID=1544741 RepID=A0A917ZR47_9ACTN|nr:SRPBCC family protein [Wenjunlia tyrosinilytica]GGO90657.1 hypothetical protein GCM10012280_36680 [Wenjunlia tyrosinilytica]